MLLEPTSPFNKILTDLILPSAAISSINNLSVQVLKDSIIFGTANTKDSWLFELTNSPHLHLKWLTPYSKPMPPDPESLHQGATFYTNYLTNTLRILCVLTKSPLVLMHKINIGLSCSSFHHWKASSHEWIRYTLFELPPMAVSLLTKRDKNWWSYTTVNTRYICYKTCPLLCTIHFAMRAISFPNWFL